MSDRLFILCIQYENANRIANDIIKLHIYPYRRLFLPLRAALLSTGGIKGRKKLRIASMKFKLSHEPITNDLIDVPFSLHPRSNHLHCDLCLISLLQFFVLVPHATHIFIGMKMNTITKSHVMLCLCTLYRQNDIHFEQK